MDSGNSHSFDAQLDWPRRLRMRPRLGALVGLVAVVCALLPFAFVDPTPYFGMPGALATAIIIFVAIAVGLMPGLITAMGAAVFFVALVANPPHPLSRPAALATALIWVAIGFVAGSVAGGLRRRLQTSFSEVQAREVQLDATLESTAAGVGLFAGRELHCEAANAALRSLFVVPQWRGTPLRHLLPSLPEDVLSQLSACRSEGSRRIMREELAIPGGDPRVKRLFSLDGRCQSTTDDVIVYLTLTDVTAAATLRRDIDRMHAIFRALALDSSPTEVAATLCREAIGLFGCSTTSFWTVEGDEVVLLARAPTPVREDRWLLEEMGDLADVVRSGQPLFVEDVHTHYAPGPEKTEESKLGNFIRQRGYHSLLSLPVVYGAQTGALLFFAWMTPIERPSDELIAVAQRFADEAAIAIERAERLDAQREAADLHRRLEQGLLPKVTAAGGDVGVAYSYLPGEERLLIGGDFIDAVLDRAGCLSFIIGDVTGHGPDSAALGSMLRAAWRVLSRAGMPFDEMLTRLDELLVAERSDDGQFTTACLARVVAGEGRLQLALAGHPAPLLFTEEDVTELKVPHGQPLGVADEPAWPLASISLPERWALLAYTDGLVEGFAEPHSRRRLGLPGLLRLIAAIQAEDGDGHSALFDGVSLDALLQSARNIGPRRVEDMAALTVYPLTPHHAARAETTSHSSG